MQDAGIISKGYKLIKWGLLISALHINLHFKIGGIQIIPSFIGFIIIFLGIRMMNKNGGERYFDKLSRSSLYLCIVSALQWIWGFLFTYTSVLSRAIIVLVFLVELLLYADLLNMTVRLYKDNNEIRSSDKLRKDRILIIKAGMGLAVVYSLSIVPKLSVFLDYTCVTLMLVFKLWLSLILQNVERKMMIFKHDEDIKKE